MSCAVCSVSNAFQGSALHLSAETGDMRELLENTLHSLGIEFESTCDLLSVAHRGDRARVVGLLRQMLSGPERKAVSVCDLRAGRLPVSRDLDYWWRVHETDWFENALLENRFEMWFQPIVDTAAREIAAHECLVRLDAARLYNGGEIVEAANVRNQIHAFDSHARRLAILTAARQNRSGRYFVNVIPSSIYNPEFCMRGAMEALAETGISPENIVFEVVESDHIRDTAHLRRICDYYRSHGFGFALDDVGTGSNSLQTMCELRPDYVKLDKSLVQNVEKPMYGATIRKLVELADQFSVRVIAEGVETIHTMENLWLLGVQTMQGYLFGRPERNICANQSGLLRLSHALRGPEPPEPGIRTPVAISCRPGSTTPARRQESRDPSLAGH